MSDVQWIKLSTGLFENRKIKQLERMCKGDTLLIIWIKLLILAGRLNDDGRVYITPTVGYDHKSLACEMNRPAPVVQQALELFQTFSMITVDESGIIHIKGWEKYQSVDRMAELTEYNRQAKQRERKKKKVNDASMTNQCGQDPEEEREEETEEEKESLSLSEADRRREALLGLGEGKVLLSCEQFDDLMDRLSIEEFDRYVAVVAKQEKSGRHYTKPHYQAILDMAEADRKIAT